MKTGGEPAAPRVVVVSPGPPHHPATWSGISARLCAALAERAALAAAVDGRLRAFDLVEKAATFSTNRERWRQRHSLRASPLYGPVRAASSRLVASRVAAAAGTADVLLQIGARHDFSGFDNQLPRLRCSYHDANVALALGRADLLAGARVRHGSRALAYERRVYDGVDVIFTMSEWARSSFVSNFEQPQEKVVVVGAGANLDPFPAVPDRDWTRPRLLFVGRHFERKGGIEVVAAFRAVHARRRDAELWLVGPKTIPMPPEPGVRFFGHLPRTAHGGEATLERLYREATAFVMPSHYEPFGIVFLEAMANALPCIGTRACAMPEIIADGRTGYVVPPGDTNALAERLLELVDDGAAAAAMGAEGRRRVEERFTWSRVAEAMAAAVASRLGEPA